MLKKSKTSAVSANRSPSNPVGTPVTKPLTTAGLLIGCAVTSVLLSKETVSGSLTSESTCRASFAVSEPDTVNLASDGFSSITTTSSSTGMSSPSGMSGPGTSAIGTSASTVSDPLPPPQPATVKSRSAKLSEVSDLYEPP